MTSSRVSLPRYFNYVPEAFISYCFIPNSAYIDKNIPSLFDNTGNFCNIDLERSLLYL